MLGTPSALQLLLVMEAGVLHPFAIQTHGSKRAAKKGTGLLITLSTWLKKKKKANKQKTSQGKEFPPWCGGLRIRRCLSYSLGCNSDLNSIPGPGNFHMPECNQTKQSKTNPQTNKQTREHGQGTALLPLENTFLFCFV